ncbi:MAG: galactokinase [Phycisphaerae bacterium]
MRDAFEARFERPAEVVTRAPGRVNLIGEHVDYNDGYVLPMALEQCTWVAAARRSDGRVRIFSENLGESADWRVSDWARDTQPHWTSYVAGVAALLRERGAPFDGADFLIRSDVPVGAGLSSSAALEIAAALACVRLSGEALMSTELADLCRAAEHQYAGVPCGIMDQYASMLAKADTALLLDCRARTFEHIPLPLDGHTVLIVDSGVRHELAAGEYAQRLDDCARATAYFRKLNPRVRALRDVSIETVRAHALQMPPVEAARSLHVVGEIRRTLAAAELLRRGVLDGLGALLAESHRSLRDDFEVSCPEVDRLVALVSGVEGVLGARMTGAGFGGCVVAIARQDATPRVADALRRDYDRHHATPATLHSSRPGAGAAVVFG